MKYQPKVFDCAIIGSGLGGLIAANGLVKENRSVLLLKEKNYHPSYIREGYRFLPFSNFSERRIQTALLNRIYRTLGIPFPAHPQEESGPPETKLKNPEPGVDFQVILPTVRIDLYRERSLLQKEWKREFPREFTQVENFYAELDQQNQILKALKNKEPMESLFPVRPGSFFKRWFPFERLPEWKMGEKLPNGSFELQKFIQLQTTSIGNLVSDSLPLSLVSHLLLPDEEYEGGKYIDLEIVIENLFKEFLESGGRVESIEGVKKMERRRREGFILSLKGEDIQFRSKSVLFNSPLHSLFSLLSKRGKVALKRAGRIGPQYVIVPIFLGIREKVVPVGMRDLLVSLQDIEKPYERGNLLLIGLSGRGDETQAPEGWRALIAQGFIPFGKVDPDSLDDLQRGVMKHLGHLFPFLENHIEFINREWTDQQISCWSYSHVLYETNRPFQWREGIVPVRLSNHLYFTGKENFPYLGIEGECLSGLMAGREISKRYG